MYNLYNIYIYISFIVNAKQLLLPPRSNLVFLKLWNFHHPEPIHPASVVKGGAKGSVPGSVPPPTSLCQRIPQLSLWKPAWRTFFQREFTWCVGENHMLTSYHFACISCMLCIHDACLGQTLAITLVLFPHKRPRQTKIQTSQHDPYHPSKVCLAIFGWFSW